MVKIYEFAPNEATEAKALCELLRDFSDNLAQTKHGRMRYVAGFDLKHDKIIIKIEVEDLKEGPQ